MSSKAYELITEVKDLALVTTTGRDTAILRKLNQAQWQIYNSHNYWRGMEGVTTATTSDGIETVDVPSAVSLIYTIRQTSTAPYAKLRYFHPTKFHEVLPQPTQYSEGSPTCYTWWQGKLYLYPIPDATYTLTFYYYKKPVSMKVYSTGTATYAASVVTGSSTYFLDNSNVDTNMYFAYPADIRSDGTLPWSAISAVTNDTTLTSTYLGNTATGAFVCSSPTTFPEDFDTLLVYAAAILECGRMRETADFAQYLSGQYTTMFGSLMDAQRNTPDYSPEASDFSSGGALVTGDAYLYPFIYENR